MGKKYRTERRRINARDVSTVTHNPDAIEHYKRSSSPFDGWSNGGRPSVGIGRGGRIVAWQGNHRIAAAAAQGKEIDVDFQVEITEDKPEKGFWSW